MPIFPLIFIVLIFVGVWGSMIISARLKSLPQAPTPADDERLEEFRESARLLEARVERIEEELGFFRELYGGDASERIGPGKGGEGGG